MSDVVTDSVNVIFLAIDVDRELVLVTVSDRLAFLATVVDRSSETISDSVNVALFIIAVDTKSCSVTDSVGFAFRKVDDSEVLEAMTDSDSVLPLPSDTTP